MRKCCDPQPKRPWRTAWALLLFFPIGFGHWYLTVALLLVSAALTYFLSRGSHSG